jgi:hypothetical protein
MIDSLKARDVCPAFFFMAYAKTKGILKPQALAWGIKINSFYL